MYKCICEVLDEMGFVVLDTTEDFDIGDYIVDSLQFISFIVAIEEKIEMCLPDDFLSLELLHSAVGFANKLSAFCSNTV